MEEFDLTENNLTGTIPDDFGTLTEFNNLSGTLSPDLGQYSILQGFEVAQNHFTGKVPKYLCANGGLIGIGAYDNNLSGELPNSLGNCSSLLIVRVNGNRLSGSISAGEIPTGLSSSKNLTVFSASNNLFVGTISLELATLSQLTTLRLDGNLFSGHLPSDFFSWKSLTTLNLNRNQLSGSISAKLGSLPSLTVLDLSRNEFSGQIPTQIGHLKLTSLNLSSNCPTGRIPAEFENTFFNASFLNNTGLCASNPSLGVEICSSRFENSSKISSRLLAIITVIATVLLTSATLLTFFLIKTCWKKEHESDSKWELTYYQKLNLGFKESDILSNLTENNNIKKFDQNVEKQFLAEVEILGTIRHSNIVKLLSCISSETTKLLAYEYLGNHRLDRWLHGKKRQSISDSDHGVVLDWSKRLKIAVGAALGQCYMHHGCKPSVIHRDGKSSNILLDSQFNAKVADFGLAKILAKHGGHNTMSTVVGSFGYIAPELVTGRKANDENEDRCLVDWAFQYYNQKVNHLVDAVDEKIKEPHYLNVMTCVFKLGIFCTGSIPTNRPSMKEVLQILLNCSHQSGFGGGNVGSDSSDFSNDFRQGSIFEGEDGSLLSIV
ncbi:LRR receptor-like serine/threonine-protein kinase HSL2 [Camellia lanceoleosa]|uniref:LRR receptor-like serine/threonine-protein kinase HSL2 n=1 Tax=Camellia lanceoleosa TaxID=1840588 RepID=A0ACC0FFI4_9ERIC|nr:LRR receptor-like serine/threonine-protein kinase HSL2 [Camellia lanceoleosa]